LPKWNENKSRKDKERALNLLNFVEFIQGRIHGSKEDLRTFLSKPKIAKTIEYLKKGYKASEISRIVGIHVNTITKVKKLVG
jgi:hypothetical protein